MKPHRLIAAAILLIGFASFPTTMMADTKTKNTHPNGIDPLNMDKTARPGDDFFRYATAGWVNRNPMPKTEDRYGSFIKLAEENDERLRSVIEDMAKNAASSTGIEAAIGNLYNLYCDTARQNAEGVKPLLPYLKMLDKVSGRTKMSEAIGLMNRAGFSALFGVGISADPFNSKVNIVSVGQSGIQMGERDYYLDNDDYSLNIRAAYVNFGRKVFAKIYPSESEEAIAKRMNDVLRIETRLASNFKSNTALRDIENNYNKVSVASLRADYPAIDWTAYFKGANIDTKLFNELSVDQPEAIRAANDIMLEEDETALKNYLTFVAASSVFSLLGDEARALVFDFYSRTLSGIEAERPTWRRGVSFVNSRLGMAVGKVYCQRYFPAEAKEKMEKLVQNLCTALGERIDAQEWMSDDTKRAAHEKLSTFYVKVGYPNTWRDYSGLTIDPKKSLLDNLLAINVYNSDYLVNRDLGKPVDRDIWYMTPQTVNAYYNPTTNEICFPAGILQYPFFDVKAEEAFNYGAIGVVIGHEMTHGFDDSGRKFDKDGNVRDWWNPQDVERFSKRAQVIVDFFNNIKVLPDLNANGELTQGENLADHGGIQVAYTAYKNATKGQRATKIHGLTPDQRFFVAYAGVWAGSIREEAIRQYTKMDSHSLGKWRVNGTLPHIDAWYDAFGITPQSKLYVPKEKRLNIW